MNAPLFPVVGLPVDLVETLRRQNPWWEERPGPPVPAFHRWPFPTILHHFDTPLAPLLVLRGPRQIGKTTLQHQAIEKLLADGVEPRRILRVQFDDLRPIRETKEPILRIADWFERTILGVTLNEAARSNRPAFLFFDEVQNLTTWDAQLKSLVDHSSVRAMVTGSSALRISLGRDSLAGRIRSVEVGPLRLPEIAALRGFGTLAPAQAENGWGDWLRADFWESARHRDADATRVLDAAFAAFSERGAYPLAQTNPDVAWNLVADQLTETVVRRVIEHDLRVGESGRKRDRQLLEDVFRMACRYAGQAPGPPKLAAELRESRKGNVGPDRVRHYLEFLDSSLLLRIVQPLEINLKKRRGFPKICLCDHAVRAAWLQEIVPLEPAALDARPGLEGLAGRIAESVVGYYFASLTGLDVAHVPARGDDPEVDFVLTVGDARIPVEVKYRRHFDERRDTEGLRWFLDRTAHRAPLGLLVTRDTGVRPEDPRIVALPLPALLAVR